MSGIFSIDLFAAPDCLIVEDDPAEARSGEASEISFTKTVDPDTRRESPVPAIAPAAVGAFDFESAAPYAVAGIGVLASAGILWWALKPRMRQNRRRSRSRR